MMREMIASTLLAMVLEAIAPQAPTAADTAFLPHERYKLDNGLEVVLHEDHQYPLVAVRLVYYVGSMHDPPGKEGVAHLLEHAMFGGSLHVADGDHFKLLYGAGASLVNAETSLQTTVYIEHVPANRLELALWLESDRMGFFDARTHRSTLRSERAIVTQESDQGRHRDEWAAANVALFELLAPEGHPMHGQDDRSIARITVDDVHAMSERYYGPANATLILAGALPPDVEKMIETYFGSLRGGERPRAEIPPFALKATRQKLIETPGARSPAALVAWPTPGLHEPGDTEADVLAQVLQWRAAGQWQEAGSTTVTGIVARQMSILGQSAMFVRVDGHPGASPHALLAELDRMLAGIARDDLSDLEVRSASRRFIVAIHRALGSLGSRAERMQSYLTGGKSPDWIDEDQRRYQRVTKQGVSAFVRTTLIGRPRAVVLVAPLAGEVR